MFTLKLRILATVLLAMLACALPDSGRAQDSTDVSTPDSIAKALPLVRWSDFEAEPSNVRIAPRPASFDTPEVVAVVGRVPGSFMYDLSNPGWPSAVSLHGADPNLTGLAYNGIDFSDIFTGRAQFEFLPRASLDSLDMKMSDPISGTSIIGNSLAPERSTPLTEAQYIASNQGLQSVSAYHAQERSSKWFGRKNRYGFLFGYGGISASGEYPGSSVERGRQFNGAVHWRSPQYFSRFEFLRNTQTTGAHSGVIQNGPDPDSIYDRFDAAVAGQSNERFSKRTDLLWRAGIKSAFTPIFILSSTSINSEFRFGSGNASDTLSLETHRVTGGVNFNVPVGSLRSKVEARLARESLGEAPPAMDTGGRTLWSLTTSGAPTVDTFDLNYEAGFIGGFGEVHPHLSLGAQVASGSVEASAHVASTRRWATLMERSDFGQFSSGDSSFSGNQVRLAILKIQIGGARSFVATTLSGRQEEKAVFWRANSQSDSLFLSEPIDNTSGVLTLEACLKCVRATGIFVKVSPSVRLFSSGGGTEISSLLDEALPPWFGTAELGTHHILFENDLDLTLSLRARYWGNMRSRVLHPATGLLALPDASARQINSSAAVDIYAHALVRGATLFVGLDNLLSGTAIAGNMIVPVYPIAEQRLRFGVTWPITN